MRLWLTVVAASLALAEPSAGAYGAANVATASNADEAPYARPSRLVALPDGRRMNLLCMGSGNPTVVFEAGLGDDSTIWRRVQPAVARFTRACAYDRAGHLYSDIDKRPSTALNAVDDLHQLLTRAGTRGPIVLVGHSIGGLYATLYADQHLPDVAGLVLVDPSFVGQWQALNAALDPADLAAQRVQNASGKSLMADCVEFARAHKERDLAAKCYPLPPTLSPVLRAAQVAYFNQPTPYQAALAEEAAFYPGDAAQGVSEDERQEQAAARSFGSLPMIVLTAGASNFGAGFSRESAARIDESIQAAHAKLATRSTRGQHRVIAGVGHNIQMGKPNAVIDAVREAVDMVRAKSPT